MKSTLLDNEVIDMHIKARDKHNIIQSCNSDCGTDNILQNIPYIQKDCEKYYAEYCQFDKTLLWL